jgi:hypothetical protein
VITIENFSLREDNEFGYVIQFETDAPSGHHLFSGDRPTVVEAVDWVIDNLRILHKGEDVEYELRQMRHMLLDWCRGERLLLIPKSDFCVRHVVDQLLEKTTVMSGWVRWQFDDWKHRVVTLIRRK